MENSDLVTTSDRVLSYRQLNEDESDNIESPVGHYLLGSRSRLMKTNLFRSLGWKTKYKNLIENDKEIAPYRNSINYLSNLEIEVELSDKKSNEYNVSSSYSCRLNNNQNRSIERGGNTSWMSGIIIMANCTIGMGLLNFPSAILRAGGILPAILVLMTILLLIFGSLVLICYLANINGDVTYQSIVGSFVGPKGKLIARILIIVNNFAALVLYMIIIGDQIEEIIAATTTHKVTEGTEISWWLNRKFLVPIISTVLIFPFCCMKNFDIFKYTSFIGLLAAFYVTFGLILFRYFHPDLNNVYPQTKIHSPSNLLNIIPLICFAFECHIETPPMVACLKQLKLSYSLKMVIGYLIISSIIYTSAGIFGYLSFGENTPEDILVAYNSRDPLVIVAYSLLSLKIITTYPVVFYCIRIVIQDVLRHRYNTNSNSFRLRLLISIPIFGLSVITAVVVPSIASVISIVGGVAACFIFVFPGLCIYKLYCDNLNGKTILFIVIGIFYSATGTFLMAYTICQAILDYIFGF